VQPELSVVYFCNVLDKHERHRALTVLLWHCGMHLQPGSQVNLFAAKVAEHDVFLVARVVLRQTWQGQRLAFA
jgi:uncharacterized protein YqgQ